MVGKAISRYRILEQIGAGGMGIVYRARDEQLERDVAIKVLPPGMLADAAARRRFRKEALSLARVNFPNIATIHEFSSERGIDFLVTEYIPGTTLDAKLSATKLPLSEVLQLGLQLAQGLAAAHQHGIVHRDLKPGNLRITPDGRLKILDFGLAQFAPPASELAETATLTKSTDLTGTLPYMAPEQLKGEGADPRSDLWAAGAVLYEMATGQRPFKQNNSPLLINAILNEQPVPPTAVSPGLPANLENIILKALEKDPARRYQSASEMYVDLERVAHPTAAGVRVDTSATTTRVAITDRLRSRAFWNVALPALLVAGILVGGFLAWKQHAATREVRLVVPGRKSIAVLGFKNLSGKDQQEWLSGALSEMLTVDLSAGDQLKTIAGENVARAKADLALADSDSFSPDTLKRLYQRLGSDLVVLGSYLEVGSEVRVDVRVQDASKGETVTTLSSSMPEAKLLELVKQLGGQLREKCGAAALTGEEAAQVQAAQPNSPDTARLYAEGIAKLQSFDNLAARQVLERAVAAEPSNALAHLALARAWRELGYDAKAESEAKRAFELSRSLSRKESLLIEANYREAARDWGRAVELYKSLWTFYPDELEYGLRLADVQVAAGQSEDASGTVIGLRQVVEPLRQDARIDLADVRVRASLADYPRAIAAAQTAARKAAQTGGRFLNAQALLEQCEVLQQVGQYEAAKVMGRQANETFQQAGDFRSQAKSLTCIANVAADQGNIADARSMHEKALALARQIGAQNDIAGALINLGNLLAANGEMEESSRNYREALSVAQAAGDNSDMLLAQSNLGVNLVGQGALDEARKQFELSARTAQAMGDQSRVVEAQINLGMVASLQGRLENARRDLETALHQSRESHLRSDEATCLAALGDLLVAQDDLTAASKRYQESLDLRTQLGEKGSIASTQIARAALAIEENQPAEAEPLASAAAEEFKIEKSPAQELAARDVLAQALLAQKKLTDAAAQVTRAAELKVSDIPTQLSFEITRGRLAARSGEDGISRVSAAEQRARQLGMVPYDLQARLALAEIQAAKGVLTPASLESLRSDALRLDYRLIARKAQAQRAATKSK
jgi:tetratricopeptide (TPR) repeat protein/TolB-like protein